MDIFKPISYQRKYTTLYYLMEQAYGSYIEVKRIILLVSFLEFFAINLLYLLDCVHIIFLLFLLKSPNF